MGGHDAAGMGGHDGWNTHRSHYPSLVHLFSWRAVADGLFASGRLLPVRIFTGYDYDWRPFDRWFYENGHDYYFEHARLGDETSRMRHLWRWRNSLMSTSCNLLGDALLDPLSGEGFPTKLYYPLSVPLSQRQQKLRELRALIPELRAFLASRPAGWLHVYPFSPSLVFLRGRKGEYAWVAPDLRDGPPPSPELSSKLTPEDLPRSWLRHFEFERWLYFRCGVWEEKESHEIEEWYYSQSGTTRLYPAWPELPRRYHAQHGNFLVQALHCPEPLNGFQKLRLADGSGLYVSELVSIKNYSEFFQQSGYATRRFLEPGYNDLELANAGDRPELPVACSYYDALAYAAWVEGKAGRPVRLLRIGEYLELHPGAGPRRSSWEELPKCVAFDQIEYKSDTGGSHGEARARFQEPLPVIRARGLGFVFAFDFGEWLFESSGEDAAAICSYDLKGIHDHDPIQRDFFPAKSWGKYRSVKIGFRLCYSAELSPRRKTP